MKLIRFYRIKTEPNVYEQYENSREAEDEQNYEENHANDDIHVHNAQSWNYETHPNGIGPSYVVDDIDYDNDTKVMTVLLRDGATFTYENVDRETVVYFIESDSKGRWWNEYSKSN